MYLLRMCDLESAIFRNSFLLADSLRALRTDEKPPWSDAPEKMILDARRSIYMTIILFAHEVFNVLRICRYYTSI